MFTGLLYCAALSSLAGQTDPPPSRRGQPPPPAEYFRRQPAGTLAHRIRTNTDSSPDRPAVSWKLRPLSDPPVLLVDAAVANLGGPPDRAAEIPIVDWVLPAAAGRDDLGYRHLTYRNDPWYGSTYWTGPDWTRVGKDWHHPGTNTASVRRFTAPRDGRITITGRVYKLDTNNGGGDGVRLSIRHRGRTLWKAEIDGDDTKGVQPKLTLDVRAGDSIRFVVHKRGQIFHDTTHWDPVIEHADGTSWQASRGFSTGKQGPGGWSYEMAVDPKDQTGLPRIHAFDRDFSLRHQTPGPGRPVVLTNEDALPIVLIADENDRSGVVIVLDEPGPWRFHGNLRCDGRLEIKLSVGRGQSSPTPQPDRPLRLPRLVVGAYAGPWTSGITLLRRLLERPARETGVQWLPDRLAAEGLPDLDLWAMVQTEWAREDGLEGSEGLEGTDKPLAEAAARHIETTRRLLEDLRGDYGEEFLAAEVEEIERLNAVNVDSLRSRKRLYQRIRRLKRRIVLANPLLDFGKLLFVKRVPTSYSHLVMQYFGWRARPGGGIFVLKEPGRSLACRDLLDGRLANGNVLEPRLSYDARRIVFCWVKCPAKPYDPNRLLNDGDEGFYHVFEVNVDGTGLRQLTSGPYDDVMPTYLPDGRIVFCSTRRGGYARCFGGQFSRRWHVYTLHRIDADGRNLRRLSFHDTNEWFPAVSHAGRVLYARWDYIDRDAVTHQNLWSSRPDGTHPATVWGNATSSPHCAFQIRPVPGSRKIAFTASAHHSIAGGSIALVDPAVDYDGQQAITRITPQIPFPEAEGRNIPQYYAAPWPLSERYFLTAYSPLPLVWEPGANAANALGIYVLDALGNRELIYRDEQIGSTNPCPLVPRPVPPVLPGAVSPDTLSPQQPPTGEMLLADVYRGLGDVAPGSIQRLRVVQIFPKTTNLADNPPVGMAREENARAVLGTVPVEPDGSAYFTVPAGKPILFQALDAQGMAYQTMRSVTYVQPGERVSCIGCHESRMTAPANHRPVAAMRRPSPIEPGRFGGRPFSFVEVVQPVLDSHCVSCHGGQKTEARLDLSATPLGTFTRSYRALCGDRDFWAAGTNPTHAAEALVPRFGGRNQVQVTPPGGTYGARGSRLIDLLRKGHENVKLTGEELARLAMWIDCNAIFYGVNLPRDQQRQLRGERLPMPQLQ